MAIFTLPCTAQEYQPPGSHLKPKKEIPRFPPQFYGQKDTSKKAPIKPFVNKKQQIGEQQDTIVSVLSKTEDANGVTTTKIEKRVGNKSFYVTYLTTASKLNRPFRADTIDLDSVSIQIVKKAYRLYIYHKHKFLTSYRCVFGPDCLNQKLCEGDKRTPEGWFKIKEIRPHAEWNTFMLLDYPTEESKKIFEENKKLGKIPKNATIGGAIGIHGTWKGSDHMVDQKRNWTDGCIALKERDLLELSTIVRPGTPILIQKQENPK